MFVFLFWLGYKISATNQLVIKHKLLNRYEPVSSPFLLQKTRIIIVPTS